MQCLDFGVFFPLLVIKRSKNSANARPSCTQLGASPFVLRATWCVVCLLFQMISHGSVVYRPVLNSNTWGT